MDEITYAREGWIAFHGYRVWYGIVGERDEPGKAPIVILHGGPGLPHDGYEPLAALASTGRRVIFYDQLGCGNSDRPSNPALWTRELFVEELYAVREALGLERAHLYGHSYGGALALNYVLTRPSGLASVTLANSFPTLSGLLAGWQQILDTMPTEVRRVISVYQEEGIILDPRYETWFQQYFVEQHVCTVPMPPSAFRGFAKMGNDVYLAMHGPRWFKVTGQFKDWDVTNRLGEIEIPALVFCGRHDQCVPALSGILHRGISGSILHIFEESAHLPYLEEPEEHLQVMDRFLTRVEEQDEIVE